MMTIENEHFNCMKMVSYKVTTIEHDNNQKLGGVGVLGAIMRLRGGVGGVLGLTGIVGTQGHKGYRRHQGHWGFLGGVEEPFLQCQGASWV